ncbi:MAG: 50S ribosomal protein L13 [Elusimicrobia bacterium]|nr:50S ribosomal protein L13 [Elusimicrobiota bacterium]
MNEINWFLLDAEGKSIGRIAERISIFLRGKDAIPFSENKLAPRGVVVINAGKVSIKGGKELKKEYFFHPTTKPGSWKRVSLGKLLEKSPQKVITGAVKGMLPKNKLRKLALSRIRVYPGSDHPHGANIKGRIDA